MNNLNIFYDDVYKKLLFPKIHKLKIKKIPNELITYKYEDNFITKDFNYQSKKNEEKYVPLNVIKYYGYKDILMKFEIFNKYYKDINNAKLCLSCFSNNYFIKKYTGTSENKNILLIKNYNQTKIGNNADIINHNNNIFSQEGYYLFKNAKNCNIYEIIDINNNNTYDKEIIEQTKNNRHHLVTHNTDGNIYNKKTMNEVINRLKNIKFDIIIHCIEYRNYMLYVDNINILLINMYITSRLCDIATIVYYAYYKILADTQSYDHIQSIIVFKNLFNSILLFNTIHYGVTLVLKLTKIDKKSKLYKELENIVNNIISGKKTVIFDTKNHKFNAIDDYINNFNKIVLDREKLIVNLLNIRENNYFIYKIIEGQIENAQFDMLHNKKYNKYLQPY